ncbi:hypothetical protein B296_00002317 [Ensete ventricosum]|uniref:Uncharacterized protein n=1 Tax=Ensete ventricosum TaxID=4639 RepID=A0A427BAM1_ENSVE|nr:hypothetical protein B296_00002317 [Ensete ventricosum]
MLPIEVNGNAGIDVPNVKGELPEGTDANGNPVAGAEVVEPKVEPDTDDWDVWELELNRAMPVPPTEELLSPNLVDKVPPVEKEKLLGPNGEVDTRELPLPAPREETGAPEKEKLELEPKFVAGTNVLMLPELGDDPVTEENEKLELEQRGLVAEVEKPKDELAEPDEEVPLKPDIGTGVDEPKVPDELGNGFDIPVPDTAS